MQWFNYIKKNSLIQIVRDYREYRELCRQLRLSQKDLEYCTKMLTREYDIEDDINFGNACLKHKKLIEATNLLDESTCRYTLSRCQFFEPIGNEKLCPNKQCQCWQNNNLYYQTLNDVKDLYSRISGFWKNKFANVK